MHFSLSHPLSIGCFSLVLFNALVMATFDVLKYLSTPEDELDMPMLTASSVNQWIQDNQIPGELQL